jgi:hypothetical protein
MHQQRKIDPVEQTMLMISSSVLDCASKFYPASEFFRLKCIFQQPARELRPWQAKVFDWSPNQLVAKTARQYCIPLSPEII